MPSRSRNLTPYTVYIGDDKFDPLWEELDKRGETVFLHGTQVVVPLLQFAHPFLGVPITEVRFRRLDFCLFQT